MVSDDFMMGSFRRGRPAPSATAVKRRQCRGKDVRSSAAVAEFRLLGPVEAVVEGRRVSLPAAKPRALLALLLLNRNRAVPVHELIDELWGEQPPETATKALQGYVSQLRKALGADRVVTTPPGYSLRVEDGELDLDRFEALVAAGRTDLAAGNAKAAAARLAEALELWRGPPFAEFDAEPFAQTARGRLEDERLAAVEDRIDAELALGRHGELVPQLEQLAAREPYRERLHGQLMLALYRSGRQADALEHYRRMRETFVDELGIEPSRELQELEQAMLRHDESLEQARAPGSVAAASPAPRRRAWLAFAAVVAAAVAVAAAAIAVSTGGSSRGSNSDRDLRVFTTKLENFLVQSRDGRRQIASAIARASRCALSPRAAAVQLDGVQRNRQSILQQIAALSVPSDEQAQRSADRLQKAIQASIAADGHYRDWLALRTRCGPPDRSPELRAAHAADARATKSKRAFLAAFNPLARRLGQEVWTAREF
jgi:DNA-binding SARP family transcriptional activator